ncbi:hypothetical protein ACFL96_08305 [Thermoproteota archaeon]
MSLGMYKDIILEKKTSLKLGLSYGKRYFFEIMGISVIYYLILGVLGIMLVYFISLSLFAERLFDFMIFLFLIIVILHWALLVILRMFFVYAAMVFQNKKLIKTIELGVHFGKTL